MWCTVAHHSHNLHNMQIWVYPIQSHRSESPSKHKRVDPSLICFGHFLFMSPYSHSSLCVLLSAGLTETASSMDTMAAWGGARCATQGRPQKTLLPFFELATLWVTIHKLAGKRGTKWPRGVFMLIIWIWRISSSVKLQKSKLLGWKVPKMTFEGKCIIQRALSCWKTNLTMDLI